MIQSIDMSAVSECNVSMCAYNRERRCHALAITVGGYRDHSCETLHPASLHAGRTEIAGVGSCKAVECKYNEDYECRAENIRVVFNRGRADCLMFEKKSSGPTPAPAAS
ncbi:MAG: DUF1540 domain-containing protein [Lentisphaerae bacterium]|nr:DUF1540 domain-containing protein [Lentisphaerota bacterium]